MSRMCAQGCLLGRGVLLGRYSDSIFPPDLAGSASGERAHIVAAIGARQARRLFVTGEIFDAAYAQRIGLVHDLVAPDKLDEQVDRVLHWLAKGGPLAQREAKHLALELGGALERNSGQTDMKNAALIARLRVSPEGQEGLTAFLDKRPPSWAKG